jgi:hypothetical protein
VILLLSSGKKRTLDREHMIFFSGKLWQYFFLVKKKRKFEKNISKIRNSHRDYNRAVLTSVLERKSHKALGKTVKNLLQRFFADILVLNREQNLLREKNRFRKKKYDF